MRKTIKNNIVITMLLSIMFFQIFSKCALADSKVKDNFRVNARCAIALDRESKEVLFEQNAYEIVPMASTTKILTAIIAIEQGDLNKKVVISKNASSVRG